MSSRIGIGERTVWNWAPEPSETDNLRLANTRRHETENGYGSTQATCGEETILSADKSLPPLGEKSRERASILFLVLLTFGVLFFVFAWTITTQRRALPSPLLLLTDSSIHPPFILGLSEMILAPDIANSTTPLMELAQRMMPAWFTLMLSQLEVLTPDVQPESVYKVRKIILKTRDLLDIFSVTYPNETTKETSGNTNDDLWHSVRHYAAGLYRSVGEFQDLHNAHVRYSQELMEQRRDVVLQWKGDFEQFLQQHPHVLQYLCSPTAFSFWHKESHLFWQGVWQLPSGADPSTPSLQKLGVNQLHKTSYYLHEALLYQNIRQETVHAIYHNLRKELRSITDEFELFLDVMIPDSVDYPWDETYAAINILKTARQLLGDINDDWTAYSIYVENDEYHLEQERLAKRIDHGWIGFKVWVVEVGFGHVIDYLCQVAGVAPSTALVPPFDHTPMEGAADQTSTLLEFLQERQRHPTHHLVIGNEAGDADTIISAITLAYIETLQEHERKTPIVAIPKADLEMQRPEVNLLLQLAGIPHPENVLLFVDDSLVEDGSYGDKVTLVDHNVLSTSLESKNWSVHEIVDHHEDERQYLRSCSGSARNIAFSHDKALVASACTLVAERLRHVWPPPYPASVGLLLLGVILLDSVNLSVQVGKVSPRDRGAVSDLLQQTNWGQLSLQSRIRLQLTFFSSPDPSLLFTILQKAKYDSKFWKSLSVRDALRLDYKDFTCDDVYIFGISTVLMPMEDFVQKPLLVPGIQRYMEQVAVDFLAIMFAFQDSSGTLYRQLAICGTLHVPLNAIATFVRQPNHPQGSLNLHELKNMEVKQDGLRIRFFRQVNVKPSRKQIGPILVDFFESQIAVGKATA